MKTTVQLRDSFLVDSVRRTSDGYLTASARVARTGIQDYKGREVGRPDLAVVRIYRPPEEVFHKDAMHSMAHRPVTFNHPPVMVDSKNWQKYSKGHTGDEVVRDGDFVRVPMVMMDQALVDEVGSGRAREFSMGYSTDLQWKKGKTPDGKAYDAVQTAIRCNHLAVVPEARGGSELRIGDGDFRDLVQRIQDDDDVVEDDDLMADDDEPETDPQALELLRKITSHKYTPAQKKQARDDLKVLLCASYGDEEGGEKFDKLTAGLTADKRPVKTRTTRRAKALGATSSPSDRRGSTKDGVAVERRSKTMKNVMIDGVPVELDDVGAAIVERHVSKLQSALDAAKKAKDDADDEQEEEKKTRAETDAAMKKACDAKDGEIAVLKKAVEDAKLTPEKLDALVKDRAAVIDAAKTMLDAKFVFDGQTVEAIRKAAVSAKLGDAAKDMNDAAIDGAFRALSAQKVSGGGAARLADGLSRHSASSAGSLDTNDAKTKALDERDTFLQNAWRNPTPGDYRTAAKA